MDFSHIVHRCDVFRQLNHFLAEPEQRHRLGTLLGDGMIERFHSVRWLPTGNLALEHSELSSGVWEGLPEENDDMCSVILHTHALTIANKERLPMHIYAESEVKLECYCDEMLEYLHDCLRYVILPTNAQPPYLALEEDRVVSFGRVLERLGRELWSLDVCCYTLLDYDCVGDALLQFSLRHDLSSRPVKPKLIIAFLDIAEFELFWHTNMIALTDARLQFTLLFDVDAPLFGPGLDAVADQIKHLLDPHFTPAPSHSSFDVCVTLNFKSLFYSANGASLDQSSCRVREDYGSDLWLRGDIDFFPERKFSCKFLNNCTFEYISASDVPRYENLQLERWYPQTVEFVHAGLRCLRVFSTHLIAEEDFNKVMRSLSAKVNFIKFECVSLLSVNVGRVLVDFSVRHKLQQCGLKPRFSVSTADRNDTTEAENGLQFLRENLAALADPRQQFIVEITSHHCEPYNDVWRSKVETLLQPFFRPVSLRNEKGRIWNVAYDLFFDMPHRQFAYVQRWDRKLS